MHVRGQGQRDRPREPEWTKSGYSLPGVNTRGFPSTKLTWALIMPSLSRRPGLKTGIFSFVPGFS